VEKYCRAKQATDDNMLRRMCIACWITKTTGTHSEYVILIAFQQQQWLHERVLLLRFYGYYLPSCTNIMLPFRDYESPCVRYDIRMTQNISMICNLIINIVLTFYSKICGPTLREKFDSD